MEFINRIVGRIYSSRVKEDIPFGFQSHVFVMRVTGTWPTTDDSRWYKLLTISFFLFVGIMWPLCFFGNMLYANNTIDEVMMQLFAVIMACTITIKGVAIYWHRDSIRELFRIHTELLRNDSLQRLHRIGRRNFRVHTTLTAFYLLAWLNDVVQIYYLKPEERSYSSTAHYPHDIARNRAVYLTVLVLQASGSVGAVLWLGVQDTLPYALLNTVCGHVAELKTHLENLRADDGDSMFNKELIRCCERYENCLKLVF